MTTFQTAVTRALETTDADLESLVVSGAAMSLGYRVPADNDDEAMTNQVAAVAAAASGLLAGVLAGGYRVHRYRLARANG